MDDHNEMDDKWDDKEETGTSVHNKKNNTLPIWGNERTMNLNPLILTNIQSSHYFKVNLYGLKTYHEVIDEIYYKVAHLEPWEKGSRKTAGQTGMCGGVRGVGAGGIVSTAFCLLYKLFTLKLTRKQVIGLINHPDSPYIRGLGFMYIRYTQPPADLWDWYEPYLDDSEELDVKAGGGQIMTIGNILKNFLCKLEWFSTLFPRIPVPIQQKIERKMKEKYPVSVQAVKTVSNRSSSRGDSRCKNDDDNYSRDRCKTSALPSEDRRRHLTYRSTNRERFRDRSPHSRNGDRSSNRDEFLDRYSDERYRSRHNEREGRREDDRDHRHYRDSKGKSPDDKYRKDERRSRDDDDHRREKKYRDEKRRSLTPTKERSCHKSEKSFKHKHDHTQRRSEDR